MAVSENRSIFWRDYFEFGVDYIMKKYGSEELKYKVKEKLKIIFRGKYKLPSSVDCTYDWMGTHDGLYVLSAQRSTV